MYISLHLLSKFVFIFIVCLRPLKAAELVSVVDHSMIVVLGNYFRKSANQLTYKVLVTDIDNDAK